MTENIPKKYLHVAIAFDYYELSTAAHYGDERVGERESEQKTWRRWKKNAHRFSLAYGMATNKNSKERIRCLSPWMMNAFQKERKRFFSSLHVDIFPATSCKECHQTGCICAHFILEDLSPCFCSVLLKDELRVTNVTRSIHLLLGDFFFFYS